MWALGSDRFSVRAPAHEQLVVGLEEAQQAAHALARRFKDGDSRSWRRVTGVSSSERGAAEFTAPANPWQAANVSWTQAIINCRARYMLAERKERRHLLLGVPATVIAGIVAAFTCAGGGANARRRLVMPSWHFLPALIGAGAHIRLGAPGETKRPEKRTSASVD